MKTRNSLFTLGLTLSLGLILSVPALASDYTVEKGDCLWKIADRRLGSGPRWVEIYDANRSDIRDPNLIYPGQVFFVPDGQASPATPEKAPAPPAEAEQTAPPEEIAAESPENAAEPAPEAVETEEPAKAESTLAAQSSAPALKPLVGTPTDYSSIDNWASLPDGKSIKDVDTLYLYPTVYSNTDKGAPEIVPVDDKTMRDGAQENIEQTCGIFSESTNVYVPYYRQSNLAAIAGLSGDELLEFQSQEQRTDVYAALDYYFEHYNDGRPYFLAGHAQGSVMLKLVLREYMQSHPEYYERMIAAYVLGYSVTNEDISANPDLKFAEGADDVGVIVSWNTEGMNNDSNICVLPDALVINPISWRRDESYAFAADNLGSRVVNESTGKVDESKPGIADAQIDLKRGVVICCNSNLPFTKVTASGIPAIYGNKSYHSGDYGLYYYNIMDNVKVRADAWFASHAA